VTCLSIPSVFEAIFNWLGQGYKRFFTFSLVCVNIARIASFRGRREYHGSVKEDMTDRGTHKSHGALVNELVLLYDVLF
jgi:hypothetical protein